MKQQQVDSPESLATMAYPPREKKNQKRNFIYSSEFQAMLDGLEDEDSPEENGQSSERKRRLSVNQVRKLEKIFEVDNKLESDKKLKIAEELGLQPRQVAIWFQNRRARWKTKQLERDYGVLQTSYEALKLNYGKLETEHEALISQLRELKEKLGESKTEQHFPAQEEALVLLLDPQSNVPAEPYNGPNLITSLDNEVWGHGNQFQRKIFGGLKDRLSESDCSRDSCLNSHLLASSSSSSSLGKDLSSVYQQQQPWLNCFQILDSRGFHQQFVKLEEQSLFSTEDFVSFFSVDDQAPPTFYW